MDKLFGKKPTVKEQLKENDRALRKVNRDVERDRRELEREEKKLEAEIKKAAKTGNKQATTILAKQLINIRKQKTRTYAANSRVQAASSTAKAMGANVKLTEAMGSTAKTMGQMNKVMNPTQVAKTMRDFEVANTRMGMTEEMMNDTLDDILNESGDEEEEDAIVSQVLDEIGIEIAGKMSDAPSAHKGSLASAGQISSKNKDADEEIERMLAQLKS
eukprot:TRINITY_DN14211_c0_g1_i6.p1 TRINITY_DN14211_c0_g1~~TRINITY_DN14211_c0_g1_i6.p1  ORF type:complete len:230 (+),score=62.87 TRINITY_DN14211_c0_g1_i6:41-691(+)